jgi:hypothetical protein
MNRPEVIIGAHNTPYVTVYADDADRWSWWLGRLEDWLLHAGDEVHDSLAEFLDDGAGPIRAIRCLAAAGSELRRLVELADRP